MNRSIMFSNHELAIIDEDKSTILVKSAIYEDRYYIILKNNCRTLLQTSKQIIYEYIGNYEPNYQ